MTLNSLDRRVHRIGENAVLLYHRLNGLDILVVPDIPGDPLAYTILRRMESFAGSINSQTGTLYNVQKALERGGVEFLNDDRPGVRLRASIVKRQDGAGR